MRILYVGSLWEGSTSLQRMQAIEKLGYAVVPVNTSSEAAIRKGKNILYRIKRKLFGPSDLAGVNKQILSCISKRDIDLVWIDKGVTVNPETLRTAQKGNIITVGYSPDDMLNPQNQSGCFIKSLPFYDIYLTTKSYNVEELKKLGCPEVRFIANAFCPAIHHIYEISPEEKIKYGSDVGFIGCFEQERAKALLFLAENGIRVRVWGYGRWNKLKNIHPNLKIENKPLWAKEYAKVLSVFKINLCFLRKVNRDLQTTRSVEIPACGGFMLAERTNEHLELFEEKKEAEYFSDNEELLRKVKYYLEHDEERELIAKAGHRRCIEGGYSNKERLKPVFEFIHDKYSI